GAGQAEPDAQRTDTEQRSRAGRTQPGVDEVDGRDAGTDGQAGGQPGTKGRADPEQRHRAELQRDDEAESESDGGRVHQCTVKDITGSSQAFLPSTSSASRTRWSGPTAPSTVETSTMPSGSPSSCSGTPSSVSQNLYTPTVGTTSRPLRSWARPTSVEGFAERRAPRVVE